MVFEDYLPCSQKLNNSTVLYEMSTVLVPYKVYYLRCILMFLPFYDLALQFVSDCQIFDTSIVRIYH